MAEADDYLRDLDWQCDRNLLQCLDYLFTSGTSSDVTFVVGESKEKISAHKSMLVARSSVLCAMLDDPVASKWEITLLDTTTEIFACFLRYLYTDSIVLTVDMASAVLPVARQYHVNHLVTVCEKFLQENMTAENSVMYMHETDTKFLVPNEKSDGDNDVGNVNDDNMNNDGDDENNDENDDGDDEILGDDQDKIPSDAIEYMERTVVQIKEEPSVAVTDDTDSLTPAEQNKATVEPGSELESGVSGLVALKGESAISASEVQTASQTSKSKSLSSLFMFLCTQCHGEQASNFTSYIAK